VKVACNKLDYTFSYPSVYHRVIPLYTQVPGQYFLIDNLIINNYRIGNNALKVRTPIYPIREGEITDYRGTKLLIEAALALLNDYLRLEGKLILSKLIIGSTLVIPDRIKSKITRSFSKNIKIKYKNEATKDQHLAKYHINKLRIIPSTLGTYYYFRDPNCLILDIGFGSINIVGIENHNVIYTETFYRSLDDVLAEISRSFKLAIKGDDIRRVFTEEELYLFGKKLNVKRLRSRPLRSLANDINAWVRDIINHILPATSSASSLIILTGGGSKLLKDYLKLPGTTKYLDDPIFCNAKGMLNYILSID